MRTRYSYIAKEVLNREDQAYLMSKFPAFCRYRGVVWLFSTISCDTL